MHTIQGLVGEWIRTCGTPLRHPNKFSSLYICDPHKSTKLVLESLIQLLFTLLFLSIQVSIEEAKATVNLWYSDRPEVLAWQKERKEEAHQTQKVHTLLGRARHLPDVKSSNPLVRSHMERAAINTPVQVDHMF